MFPLKQEVFDQLDGNEVKETNTKQYQIFKRRKRYQRKKCLEWAKRQRADKQKYAYSERNKKVGVIEEVDLPNGFSKALEGECEEDRSDRESRKHKRSHLFYW